MKHIFYIILALFVCTKISASHIVGGEIFYDRLNDSTYKVTLKVYRDCFTGQFPFDGVNDGVNPVSPALLWVFDADSLLVGSYDLGVPLITQVPPSINNPCIQPPGGVCVEQGLYTYTITLPPRTGGYTLVYKVVFRNVTVTNLVAPGTQGATYFTVIPGPEQAGFNSSPRYINFPPIFVCNNVDFTFDHKATDPDGDLLVYSLCEPFNASAGNPPPPPFQNVSYSSPYSGSYPISSSPAFSINSTTGILSGKPNLTGQFVVGVCVQEFRGNVLINTHLRDFQFNVVPCVVNVVSAVANQKSQCEGSTITFTNTSSSNIGALTYHWDFGVPGINSDTSNLFNPVYTYADTGKYEVTLIANPGKPCSDTLRQLVYVYPKLDVKFPPVARQCFRGNSFSFTTQGSYLPYASFNWDFTANAVPPVSAQKDPFNIKFNQPGKYFVSLIAKQHSCIDTFIDSVRIIAPPVAKINNLPVQLCDPARVGFSNGSTSDLPLSHQWFFSNGNSSQDFQPLQVFSPPGVYSATLVVTTTSVCADTSMTAIHHITVSPTPHAAFTFSPHETTIFDPEITVINNASSDVVWWDYAFGDGEHSPSPDNIHVYQNYGDFIIKQTVMNAAQCTDTVSSLVRILPEFRFWTPNTFTPDDNKMNDLFMPVLIGVENYEFRVFSRWGEEIFFTGDPKAGWNGTFKGKDCPEDVYAWKATFKNVVSTSNEVHYGHVLLLRNR